MGATSPVQACDRVSTRELLTNTAERLFAEKGLEGVSLRAVSAAAGQANNVAVQYHFTDRRGLILAILHSRLVDLDRRRGERLAMATREGRDLDARGLVELLFRPMAESVEADGRNIHARFLLHFLTEADRWVVIDHPIGAWANIGLSDAASPTVWALEMLAERLGGPGALVRERITHMMRMFLGALVDRENALAYGRPAATLERVVEDQLNMITVALATPPPAG